MATFRVGQRVKLKYAYYPENARFVGITGTIRTIGECRGAICWNGRINEDAADCSVEWDVAGAPTPLASFDQLEPIIDEGRTVITWDACCWQPPRELVSHTA